MIGDAVRYHHFGSKIELYMLLVSQANARVQPIIDRAFKEGGTPLGILRRLWIDVLVFVSRDEEFRAIQEIVLFKTATIPELSEGIERKKQGTRQLIDLLTELIQAGQESNEIRKDVDARIAALAFLSFQNGVLTQWLFDPELFALNEQAEFLAAIYLRGIAAS